MTPSTPLHALSRRAFAQVLPALALCSTLALGAAQAQSITAQTWEFNDASGTLLTGAANAVLGGSVWTANIGNGSTTGSAATTGSGGLRLGYNSTSVANSFAPLNIVSGASYYATVTFAEWGILNGAASGTTRPVFNLGLRSAAGTASSLVADLQFTATATGVTMLPRDAQSDFTANAVVLPSTLPGPLTVTLKVDKTSNPAKYTVTYAIAAPGGLGGSVTGNLGTTSTARNVSHVSLAVSGNLLNAGANVAPLIDRIQVQYDDLPVVILPPADGRPGMPSNLTTFLNGNRVQSNQPPVGGPAVLLMGGGTEVDAAFTGRAYPLINGGDIVVLRVSGGNGYQTYLYTDLVNQLPEPLRTTLQPNSVETLIVDSVAKANSDYVAQAVSRANMVWMAGGDQSQYTQFWRGTALAAALRQAYARGAVVGGTSAGMVVSGEWMYDPGAQSGVTSAEAVANPYRPNVILTTDLFGLDLGFNLVPEPHFANRDRMGRLLTFMARLRQDARTSLVYGIGLDECSSMWIDSNRIGTFQNQLSPCSSTVVSAAGYVLREDRRNTQRVQVAPGQPLIYRRVLRSKMAPGSSFDFARGLTNQPTTSISVEGALPISPYSSPAAGKAITTP